MNEEINSYPDWHPAAQGALEEKPEDGAVPTYQQANATPYTGKREPALAKREAEEKQPAQERKGRYSRYRNPSYKKGFRRPKPNPNSPYAPAFGAAVHQDHEGTPKGRYGSQKSAPNSKNTLMFSAGSRLAETAPSDEFEAMLVAELGERPENSRGGRAGRGQRSSKEPESEYSRAKNIVYNQLAASAKSRAMLEKKLQAKEISQTVIDEVLTKFEAAKLINDEEYAQMYVRDRAAGKKLSRSAIARELKTKGVAEEYVAEALEQRSEEDERADAQELVRKKLRISMDLSDRKEKEKIMRRLVSMLARKGYPSSMAFSVVKEEIDAFIEEHGIDSAAADDYYG